MDLLWCLIWYIILYLHLKYIPYCQRSSFVWLMAVVPFIFTVSPAFPFLCSVYCYSIDFSFAEQMLPHVSVNFCLLCNYSQYQNHNTTRCNITASCVAGFLHTNSWAHHPGEHTHFSLPTLGGVFELHCNTVFPVTLFEGQKCTSPACDWSTTVLFKALVSASWMRLNWCLAGGEILRC